MKQAIVHHLNGIFASLVLYAAYGTCLGRAEDWQGLKSQLTQAGVTPALAYQADAAANTLGGIQRGASYSGNLHLQLLLDGERLAGLPGLSGLVDVLWINGGQPSEFTGDAQGVSNIAAPPALRAYEAWLQYNFPGNRFSILDGRYDLNTEFYRLNSASLFLNSSFGIGPEFGQSGFAGPSVYPDTSLGVRLAYKPYPNTVLRVAVLDGAPLDPQSGSPGAFNGRSGLLVVAEAAFLTRPVANDAPPEPRSRIGRQSGLPPYDDKIALGAWYYTANFDDLGATGIAGSPLQRRGEGGAYLLLDRLLFDAADDTQRHLTGFVQLGLASQTVDRFAGYIGAGLTAFGLISGRPNDELGIAAAMAANSSHYIAGQQRAGLMVNPAEIAIELSYLAQVAPWLAVQPDLQYVIHPNTDPNLRNAMVAQLRIEMSF